ncbi:hypothetical protein [Paraburkholderia agricolaris]|uniref:hypothetical protein n=1 Tax=Paraburkholderia agricolaris TaxID=2152888 RepID=UPI0012927A65|nr:hypothetical protein [Paraburkholderia agricolaris]
MLFAASPTPFATSRTRHAVRERYRSKEITDSPPGLSTLAGWYAYRSEPNEPGTPQDNDCIEFANLSEAIQQIIQLRESLRETREEIAVLAEALEYARSIYHEKNEDNQSSS